MQSPFPKNYVVAEDDVESIEYHIHHFGELDSDIYLTKEKNSMYAQEDVDKGLEEESEQYQKWYMYAIYDV